MDIKYKIENLIKKVLENLKVEVKDINLEHPEDFKNGDYSTNVAMVYAKQLKMNPKELAEKIVNEMKRIDSLKTLPLIKGEGKGGGLIQEIQIAGPGFINFYLSREFFTANIENILKQGENWGKNNLSKGKKIMVEYTQPNPFKPFHIGHLMSNAIGESISRIVEFSGANIIRANYQGDVGPHIAKAIYILIQDGLPRDDLSISQKAEYIGLCYSKGSNLYDSDENIKKEITEINKKIYNKSDKKINEIYNWGIKITLESFEEIYKILGTKFDKYYFESQMINEGKKIVWQNFGEIFEESEKAIVFHGEKYDSKLHTRVFINSQGLPTYETKELGLSLRKFKKSFWQKSLDLSIVITANEQAEYMKVVQKAISVIHPDLEKKMKHVVHGMMRFAEGKMSSRLGNVVTGVSLLQNSINVILEKVADRNFSKEEKNKISEIVGVSALKYSILRSSLGSDIVFDFEKSISFEGDSGPYLQYTAVRAKSILVKALEKKVISKMHGYFSTKKFLVFTPSRFQGISDTTFFSQESLEKTLHQFPEIVEKAYLNFEPHHIATYLTQLASSFNSFYVQNKILSEDNSNIKYHLKLVQAFYQTMQNGLWLLGIQIPEKM